MDDEVNVEDRKVNRNVLKSTGVHVAAAFLLIACHAANTAQMHKLQGVSITLYRFPEIAGCPSHPDQPSTWTGGAAHWILLDTAHIPSG